MKNSWWMLLGGWMVVSIWVGIGCDTTPSKDQLAAMDCPGCDSLFLGFELGMTEEAFFDHCRMMNKAGILFEGNAPNTVSYKIEGFTVAARTLMLPAFSAGEITRFDMRFQYEVLPMFRPDLTQEKLMGEVETFLSDELALAFEEKEHPEFGTVKAHRKGYRQLFVYPRGEYVWATFLDLRTAFDE